MNTRMKAAALVCALALPLSLTACGEDEPKTSSKAGAKADKAAAPDKADVPATFYFEPLNSGCDKLADLDTTTLLGAKLAPVPTLDSSTDSACVWSMAGDDGSAAAAQVEVGIDMMNEEDSWADYQTFEASDWWMADTKEVSATEPFWAFASYWDWSTTPDSYSPMLQLNTDDGIMYRMECSWRGEPQAVAEEQAGTLTPQAEEKAADLQAFCNDALERAVVETN